MARKVAGWWIAQTPRGEFGHFRDELQARRAEEAWWASPLNVTYEVWVERHKRGIGEDGYGDYPRWNTRSVGWEWIAKWGKKLSALGGWDGLNPEARDVWIRRCQAEAISRGKIKVEREDEDLVGANRKRHVAQLERSRAYQAGGKGKRDALVRKERGRERREERERMLERYGLSEGA